MIFSLSLKIFWRELKSGQLNTMMLALILAVTCVAGISLFTDRLCKALQLQTAEFLGGDLKYESNSQLGVSAQAKIDQLGVNSTEMVLFASVIASENEMQFSSIKVIDKSYPLAGYVELELQNESLTQSKQEPSKGTAWLDSRLIDLLEAKIGDKISIGEGDFVIEGVLISEPDRGSNNYAFAPKAIIGKQDLARTEIIQPGSRVRYAYLFTGAVDEIEKLQNIFENLKRPGDRITLVNDNEGSLGRAVKRSSSFFLLGSLLAVLMSAFTIGISSQKFTRRHLPYVAILKSLGTSATELKLLYGLIFLWLALFSLFLGLSSGWIIQDSFIDILKSYFPTELPKPGIKPFFISSITLLLCLVGFVYPNIIKLLGISPLSILRRDTSATSISKYLYPAVALTSMFFLLLIYTEQLILSAILFVSIMAIALIGLSIILLLFGKRAEHGLGATSPISLAWSELHRRKYTNSIQVLAFTVAIGLSLIALIARTDLMSTWESSVPENSPNNFAINISKEEVQPITTFLKDNGIEPKPFYPISSAKLQKDKTAINEDGENISDRSFNITWTETLPENNSIKDGEWFLNSSNTGLSISDEISSRYLLKVGDQVKITLQGVEIETYVQSIRSVNWESFSPNFFVIGHPKMFKDSPSTYITSFFIPEEKDATANELISKFRTVSVLSIDAIIQQVTEIINQVSKALEVILGLTILSASFLTLSTLQDGFNLRMHQAAVLRTLGASKNLLQRSIFLEFSFLGLLSGLLAALLAQTGIYFIETEVFEVEASFHTNLWLIGPAVGFVFISVSSFFLLRTTISKSPKEILFNA
jgi:putative ABC transport system permease protein